jgi:hypothetical protein
MLVGAPNEPGPARWLDLHMMVQVGGQRAQQGRVHALFAAAGLRLIRVQPQLVDCRCWKPSARERVARARDRVRRIARARRRVRAGTLTANAAFSGRTNRARAPTVGETSAVQTLATSLDTAETRLGRRIQPLAAAHPSRSGVIAIPDGHDAFAARSMLADAAERTLDVQYYIYRNDVSGGSCSRRCGARPTAACACGSCSTTSTRPVSTRCWRPSTRTRRSKRASSTRSLPAAGGGSRSRPISRA